MADRSHDMDGPPAGLHGRGGAGKGKRHLPVSRDIERDLAFGCSVRATERRDVTRFSFTARGDVEPLGRSAP